MGKVKITNKNLGGFVGAGARVVEEQEKKVIASPLRTLEVGGREECFDFRLLQIRDRRLSAFLERYGTDLSAPSEMLGAMEGNKSGQRVDSRQSLVPGRNRAVSVALKINEESSH
jgi:hypothetical protein